MFTRNSQWRAVLASAFIPAAVVFAVPGLTENWRAHAGDHFSTKRDPYLLIAGEAAAFACNLVAAVVFVLRLTGADVAFTTIVTMLSLASAVVLDVLCLALFGAWHSHRLHDGEVLSPAFYLTVTSGVFSLAGGAALLVDWRNMQSDPIRFLTPKQRSLSLMSFIFMAYLLCGSLMFKYVLDESFLDAIYFVLSSTLTVGYGDVEPHNLSAKILTIIFFPIGIIQIAIIVTLIHDTVLTSIRPRVRRRTADRLQRQVNVRLQNPHAPHPTYEEVLRHDIFQEEKQSYYKEMAITFVLFIIFWIVIGYGDYSPKTAGGRAFYIGWGVAGIVILTMLFTLVAEIWTVTFADSLRSRVAKLSRARREKELAHYHDLHRDPEHAVDAGHLSITPCLVVEAPTPILGIVPEHEKFPLDSQEELSCANHTIPPCLASNPISLAASHATLLARLPLSPTSPLQTQSRTQSIPLTSTTSCITIPIPFSRSISSGAAAASRLHVNPLTLSSATQRHVTLSAPTTQQHVLELLIECERYLQLILNGDLESARTDLVMILQESDEIERGIKPGTSNTGVTSFRDQSQERNLLNEDADEVIEKMLLNHTNYQLQKLRLFQQELMQGNTTTPGVVNVAPSADVSDRSASILSESASLKPEC
ncbi:hypothetical protein DL93DRAFT_2162208 [Clavulina sp. PMI_390]|nr:hypothetical protein DL93DRAFT_2162208 [Clavulina sp. PMI_390]